MGDKKVTKKNIATIKTNTPIMELLMAKIDFQKLIDENLPLIQKTADTAMKKAIREMDFEELICDARDSAMNSLEGQISSIMRSTMLNAFLPRR